MSTLMSNTHVHEACTAKASRVSMAATPTQYWQTIFFAAAPRRLGSNPEDMLKF